jgi:tetratricopeptide (TPR) repeat protein
MRHVRGLVPALAIVILQAGTAAGQEDPKAKKEEAKKLFLEGVDLFAAGSYEEALASFTSSHDLNPNPNVLYNIGMCQRELGDFAASLQTLTGYLEKKGASVPEKEKSDIEAVIAEMKGAVGTLEISVSEKKATITIDGKPAGGSPLPSPVVLNEGPHLVEVVKEGFAAESRTVTVKGGEALEASFSLSPLEKPAPPEEVLGPQAEESKKKKKKKDILKSPLLWSLLGVAIVGGAAAAGIIVWKTRPGPMEDGDWIVHGK